MQKCSAPAAKLIISLLLVCGLCMFTAGYAKQRALIVGINEYDRGTYNVPNLAGCVADAQAMYGLLVSRFSFQPQEIATLYNKEATRKNIAAALETLVSSAQKDDVIFFYYAGHGISFINTLAMKHEKTTEALLAHDVSSPVSSVLFDFELSTYYNRIMQKGAVLTVIFDCCHSGNMTRNFTPAALLSVERADEKSRGVTPMQIWGDYNVQAIDSAFYAAIDKADSSLLVVQVNEDSAVNLTEARSMPFTGVDLRRRVNVPRPHEIRGGRFLFIGASQGVQKSYEKRDAYGQQHGAFTQALVSAYYRLPARTPVSQVMREVEKNFERQYLQKKQWPNVLADASRLQQHLLGSALARPTDEVVVSLKSAQGSEVTLEAVSPYVLQSGFQLRGQRNAAVELTVSKTVAQATMASLTRGAASALNAERNFVVQNRQPRIPPALVVFIPPSSFTLSELNGINKEVFEPALQSQSFLRYGSNPQAEKNYVFVGRQLYKLSGTASPEPVTPLDLLTQASSSTPYFIYQPLSAEVIKLVMGQLANDGNVVFTNDAARANCSLYLAYDRNGVIVAVCTDELIGTRLKSGRVKAEHLRQPVTDAFNSAKAGEQAALITDLILRTASTYRWLQ